MGGMMFWLCFNPRARMGRDGADALCTEELEGFNPRARMGRDKA